MVRAAAPMATFLTVWSSSAGAVTVAECTGLVATGWCSAGGVKGLVAEEGEECTPASAFKSTGAVVGA